MLYLCLPVPPSLDKTLFSSSGKKVKTLSSTPAKPAFEIVFGKEKSPSTTLAILKIVGKVLLVITVASLVAVMAFMVAILFGVYKACHKPSNREIKPSSTVLTALEELIRRLANRRF